MNPCYQNLQLTLKENNVDYLKTSRLSPEDKIKFLEFIEKAMTEYDLHFEITTKLYLLHPEENLTKPLERVEIHLRDNLNYFFPSSLKYLKIKPITNTITPVLDFLPESLETLSLCKLDSNPIINFRNLPLSVKELELDYFYPIKIPSQIKRLRCLTFLSFTLPSRIMEYIESFKDLEEIIFEGFDRDRMDNLVGNFISTMVEFNFFIELMTKIEKIKKISYITWQYNDSKTPIESLKTPSNIKFTYEDCYLDKIYSEDGRDKNFHKYFHFVNHRGLFYQINLIRT